MDFLSSSKLQRNFTNRTPKGRSADPKGMTSERGLCLTSSHWKHRSVAIGDWKHPCWHSTNSHPIKNYGGCEVGPFGLMETMAL